MPFLGAVAAIQGGAVNISSSALLSVSKDLSIPSGLVALTASVQTILIAASVVTTGLLADRLGRRVVLFAALLVGAAGGLVCALSPVFPIYLVGQALLGIAMGAIYSASFAFVRAVVKPDSLAGALGIFSAVMGLAVVIMTFVGGSLVGVNWRFALALIALITVIAALAVPLVLPTVPKIAGSSMDILGIIGFLYGVSQLGVSLTAPRTLIPLIGGIVLLALFFVRESRTPGAVYPVHLFRSAPFIAAVLVGFVYNFGTAVAFLQTTNLWQYVTGVSTRDLAFWQLPLIGAGVVGALIFGRLMSRGLSNRGAILVSTLITGVGFVLLGFAATSKSFWVFLPGLVVTGAGLIAASIPFGNLIIQQAPPDKFGPVTSSRMTIGQFWYSIGFAAATIVVDRLTMGGVTKKLTEAGVQPEYIGQAVTSVNQYVSTGEQPSTELARQALADASASYATSFTVMMLITAALTLITGLAAVWLMRRSTTQQG